MQKEALDGEVIDMPRDKGSQLLPKRFAAWCPEALLFNATFGPQEVLVVDSAVVEHERGQ